MPGTGNCREIFRSGWWRPLLHGAFGVAALAAMMFSIPEAVAAFKYLKSGMAVPDFTLKDLKGGEVAISQFKGAPVTMIVFWSTWSPRSEPALADAQKLLSEYGEKGLKILAVNVNGMNITHQDRQAIKKMTEDLGLTMPVAIDEGLGTYNAFGVVATPSMAVLDPEGKIVFEAASYLRATGENIREQVEILLGVREPSTEAVAEEPAYKPVRKALLYYNLGRNLLRLGSREKAAAKLEDAVEADDKFAPPRIILGHLLLGEKTAEALARAEELFRGAVDIDEKNVSALTGLGEVLLETGKIDEAVAFFTKAIAIDPAFTPAVSNMALALARQGKTDESREQFNNALELNPLDPGIYHRRGESLEVQGNLGGAAADYRRAVEIIMNLPASGDEV